jgi:hypothetical protein
VRQVIIDNNAIASSMTRSKRSSQASMSRFTAQKSPRGFGCTEAHVGEPPLAVADPDDDPSNLDRHPQLGFSPTIRRARQEMQAPKPALDRKDPAATPSSPESCSLGAESAKATASLSNSWTPEARQS